LKLYGTISLILLKNKVVQWSDVRIPARPISHLLLNKLLTTLMNVAEYKFTNELEHSKHLAENCRLVLPTLKQIRYVFRHCGVEAREYTCYKLLIDYWVVVSPLQGLKAKIVFYGKIITAKAF
jgi:hypothetical protein